MYDDVEVPALFRMEGHYYLAGSIREDVKVHYWHSDSLMGPYEALCENTLLPRGNCAPRITTNGCGHRLVWNFHNNSEAGVPEKLLPPPKRLEAREDGQLSIHSFSGLHERVGRNAGELEVHPMTPLLANPSATAAQVSDDGLVKLACRSGYGLYACRPEIRDLRLRARVNMVVSGKMGLFFRADAEANAYFVSLDLVNGFAQIRHWGIKGGGLFDDSFSYGNLQENHFRTNHELAYDIELIVFGGYIEFSVNGAVVLSLIDTTYQAAGYLGFYVESAAIELSRLSANQLVGPSKEDYGPL
jgi:beta-fructofuranosidase